MWQELLTQQPLGSWVPGLENENQEYLEFVENPIKRKKKSKLRLGLIKG